MSATQTSEQKAYEDMIAWEKGIQTLIEEVSIATKKLNATRKSFKKAQAKWLQIREAK